MCYPCLLLAVSAPLLARGLHAGHVAIAISGEVAVHLQRPPSGHIPRGQENLLPPVDEGTRDNTTKEHYIREASETLKEQTSEEDIDLSVAAVIKKLRDKAPRRPADESSDLSEGKTNFAPRDRIENVTVAAFDDCVYQYPEPEHLETLLGCMVNHLTKMFVATKAIIRQEDARRSHETRFRVISKKDNGFFDHIYGNTTEEYKKFFKSTTQRVNRSGRDPCSQQPELKRSWRALLRRARRLLAAGGRAGARLLLAEGGRRGAGGRVRRALARLERRAAHAQLAELCDAHQLCYHNLL